MESGEIKKSKTNRNGSTWNFSLNCEIVGKSFHNTELVMRILADVSSNLNNKVLFFFLSNCIFKKSCNSVSFNLMKAWFLSSVSLNIHLVIYFKK